MSKTKSVVLVIAVALAALAGVSVSVFFYAQTLHVDPVPCPTDSTLCGTEVSPQMVRVPCPSEDSCVPDYHDGAWTIVPVTP